MSSLTELVQGRELLFNLTRREVAGKYKGTLLGQGWSLFNPLAATLIYTAVFGLLLRVKVPPGNPSGVNVFALWLLCGLLPWTFMNNALFSGMATLLGNSNLIKKVYFPREVLVTSTVLAQLVTFGTELVVLTLFLLLVGGMPLPWIPLVLLVIVLLTGFSLGVALALSVANVYFRDTQHFVSIFFQIWFYATPVLYPMTYISDAQAKLAAHGWTWHGHVFPLETLYGLNPMTRFVEVFRAMLYDNTFPHLSDVLWCVGWCTVALVVGWRVFQRYEPQLAEEL